jgi:hypothetical protein
VAYFPSGRVVYFPSGVRNDLVPRLNLVGLELGRDTTVEAILTPVVSHEPGTFLIGDADGNQYLVNYEIRLRLDGLAQIRTAVPGGTQHLRRLSVTLLIDVNCIVTAGPDLGVVEVWFGSARLFSVVWNHTKDNYDVENLAESVELLTV